MFSLLSALFVYTDCMIGDYIIDFGIYGWIHTFDNLLTSLSDIFHATFQWLILNFPFSKKGLIVLCMNSCAAKAFLGKYVSHTGDIYYPKISL